ncbi:MAG TPA: IS630 family transposase [Oscillatoriaceae cyanobacterium M33_DOE_052]|nr:IS630 family transposase [Oscillatoriaceae cyanobacterium M33_DOE_052]
MGRKLAVEWKESAEELKKRFRQERSGEQRLRLQAMWYLRQGKELKEVAKLLGLAYRTLPYWVAWYREGGLSELLKRVKGHGKQGRKAKLKPIQQSALRLKVKLGQFRTVWEAVQWVAERWGIDYSYSGLHARLRQMKCGLKVPRPRSIKADVEAQEIWRAQGLRLALEKHDLSPLHKVWFCDEMRFGLWGQVRRRWGCRGVKIIQPIQIELAWQYLFLAVDVPHYRLYWGWTKRMTQGSLIPLLQQWQPQAVIWDGASSHRGKEMGKQGFVRISLPPYSPELNPCERVFEWLRSRIEGEVYPSLDRKRARINFLLRQLNADPRRLRSLIGWQWILDAFAPPLTT